MPYDLRSQPPDIERALLHFGLDLRLARHSASMTQRGLAGASGVAQSAISMAENGIAEGMRLEQMARLVASLGSDLIIRPCPHPTATFSAPWNGRMTRLVSYVPVPGERRLVDPRMLDPRRLEP